MAIKSCQLYFLVYVLNHVKCIFICSFSSYRVTWVLSLLLLLLLFVEIKGCWSISNKLSFSLMAVEISAMVVGIWESSIHTHTHIPIYKLIYIFNDTSECRGRIFYIICSIQFKFCGNRVLFFPSFYGYLYAYGNISFVAFFSL